MTLIVENLRIERAQTVIAPSVSFQIRPPALVRLRAPLGYGKTTLIHMLAGLAPIVSGAVSFNGHPLAQRTVAQRAALGIHTVLDHRLVYTGLTVAENLRLGARHNHWPASPSDPHAALTHAYQHFPFLHARRRQKAGNLSGGEQQALVLARALVSSAQLVLLDEPSEGFSANFRHALAAWVVAHCLAHTSIIMIAEASDLLDQSLAPLARTAGVALRFVDFGTMR